MIAALWFDVHHVHGILCLFTLLPKMLGLDRLIGLNSITLAVVPLEMWLNLIQYVNLIGNSDLSSIIVRPFA